MLNNNWLLPDSSRGQDWRKRRAQREFFWKWGLRRQLRFTLRDMFVVTFAFAALFAFMVYPYRQESAAVQEIRLLGGRTGADASGRVQ